MCLKTVCSFVFTDSAISLTPYQLAVPNAPSKLKFKYKNMRASVPEESPLAHKSVPAADSAPKPKRVRLSMPTPADVQSAAASVSAPNEN